jgi:hypothetical protein
MLIAAERQTLIQASIELAFEFAQRPALLTGLNLVKAAFLVLHAE